jgi:hypothetical protein
MISKHWRERLTFTAMSVFVAWHATATILAPAPNNGVIAIALRPIFQPYLSLFRGPSFATSSKTLPARATPSCRRRP